MKTKKVNAIPMPDKRVRDGSGQSMGMSHALSAATMKVRERLEKCGVTSRGNSIDTAQGELARLGIAAGMEAFRRLGYVLQENGNVNYLGRQVRTKEEEKLDRMLITRIIDKIIPKILVMAKGGAVDSGLDEFFRKLQAKQFEKQGIDARTVEARVAIETMIIRRRSHAETG